MFYALCVTMWIWWEKNGKQLTKVGSPKFYAQDLLSDVEVYSPDGRCSGVKVADLPSPRLSQKVTTTNTKPTIILL